MRKEPQGSFPAQAIRLRPGAFCSCHPTAYSVVAAIRGTGWQVLKRRGVTLIEAVLFISVALGLIVVGLVFFQQASLLARVNTQIRVLAAIATETRSLLLISGYRPAAREPHDTVLIAVGAVPPDM